MPQTVAVIAPGAMGSAVGRCLRAGGISVRTMLAGRGAASRARAVDAGMLDATAEAIAGCAVILSIVPPGQALALARELAPALAAAPASRKPVFVDCNAIAPASMDQIVALLTPTGCAVVDGAIIGPPPDPAGVSATTRLYLSGAGAAQVAGLAAPGMAMVAMAGGIGAASALKMSYAGITKGFTALGAAMMLAAEAAGAAPALRAELAESQPALSGWLGRQMPKMPDKAYRWVAEMEEIAAFMPAPLAGAPIYAAIAQFYAAIASDHAGPGTQVATLAAFCEAGA